jgi:hypothetical protein
MGEGPAQSEPHSFTDPSSMSLGIASLRDQAVASQFLILTRS